MLSGGILRRCFLVVRIHHPELHDHGRIGQVSSAGLRVLLMMYKSLEDKEQFEMTGVSDAVREILETTGFDQFLL